MSVTTSSATVEPPPLLFGQRSPSPPSFSSHPSPNHLISPRSPTAFGSQIDDIDMSTSTTLPPQGQNHDREDLAMDEPEDDTVEQAEVSAHSDRNADFVSAGAAGQGDAMDTTPVGPNSSSDENPLSNPRPDNGRGTEPTAAANTSATEIAQDQAGPALQADNAVFTSASNGAPVSPGDVVALPMPIGAVPPRAESPPAVEDGAEDSSSSDEDDDEDDSRHWRQIHEDTSSPDERELKEIEALGEISALDHAHWEKTIFTSFDDPEYSAGPSGRIEWTITNYNGTKENPNKEVLMKSPIVNIGGYDWQIKLYPKGNDSEYLSVYVECVNMAAEKKDPSKTDNDKDTPSASIDTSDTKPHAKNITTATRPTPLPLLNAESVPPRPSVAAQVSVVLYNSNEPRVNYSKHCLHRFCPDSPDWGWTRFHGPHYEIQSRHRGQRQALLRNDTLAFTSYIRIIEDETGCLGEHESRDNPWDSFAMTGLQGLMGLEPHGAPGGNLISAIASWMLLKPFRQLLYEVETPDPAKDARKRPMPVLAALQKILYQMRTQVQPRSGPVDLEDITDALEWYGFDEDITKLDVIQIWGILRSKIDYELSDEVSNASPGSHAVARQRISDLFGSRKDISVEVARLRVAVGGGINTMQGAVDNTSALNEPTQQLPQILQIQLERQEFDEKTRTWKKRMDKLQLDDAIQVGNEKRMSTSNHTEGAEQTALPIGYTLYGFVAHKEDLQSGLYYPVLRPEGPRGRWYSYQDGKDDYKVICMTRRQALDVHIGSSGSASTAPVAYVALYVRDDIAQSAFDLENEPAWTPPEWLTEQVRQEKEDSEIHVESSSEPTKVGAAGEADQQEAKETEYHVIDSRIFLKHQGPGIIDVFDDAFWTQAVEAGETTGQTYVHSVILPSTGSPESIRKLIAESVGDVDPKRCKLWIMDSRNRSMYRPDFIPTDRAAMDADWTAEDLGKQWPERRLWLHLLDLSEVQETKKNRTETTDDTPMSGTEAEPTSQVVAVEIPIPPPPSTPPPPPMDFDEMDGVLGDLPPPPPPPPAPEVTLEIVTIGEASVEINDVIPPRLPSKYDHDEVYIFLKFFDAERQTLSPRGSFLAHKSDYVDRTVLKHLDLPEDTKLRLYEEEEIATVRKLRPHCTFQQSFLYNTTIIIAQHPPSLDAATALAARGAYADPQFYLSALSTARNFPALAAGAVTLNHFSAEHYRGAVHNGQPHGRGRKVYFSGDVYEGAFVLGQRHGLGTMVFANGDRYEGEWADNQQHGTGTFVEATSGNRYVGGWRNDRKFGEGVTYWQKAEEAERLCRICWEEGADAAFYDCGHVVACLGCARRVDNCPVCRRRVLAPVKLYF